MSRGKRQVASIKRTFGLSLMHWKATVRISDSRAVKAVGCLVVISVVWVVEEVVEGEWVCR